MCDLEFGLNSQDGCPLLNPTICPLPPMATPQKRNSVEIEKGRSTGYNKNDTSGARSSLRILFTRLIIVFGAMYITIVGLRTVKNTGSLLPLSSWSSCRGKILGSGSHRNFGTLPTHYILPSGDRIPSIALGAAVTIQYQILLLLIILTKVYGRLIRAK